MVASEAVAWYTNLSKRETATVTPSLRQKAAKQNQMTASYYKFRQKAVSNMLTDTFSVCEEAHLYYLDYKSFIFGKTVWS